MAGAFFVQIDIEREREGALRKRERALGGETQFPGRRAEVPQGRGVMAAGNCVSILWRAGAAGFSISCRDGKLTFTAPL
jgi:hypothetical protein